MNEYAEICLERDVLLIKMIERNKQLIDANEEIDQLEIDCIRLQQEINCLRMEPCQLPACEKNQRDIEKMKLSHPTSEWIKDRDAWKVKADELARDLAVAKLEILGLRGGAEFFKAQAGKLAETMTRALNDDLQQCSPSCEVDFSDVEAAIKEYHKECK